MSKKSITSERQLRVSELIKTAIADAILRQKIQDPVLSNNMVSITRVHISPDLKIANCYVRSLYPESHHLFLSKDALVAAFERSKFAFRKWVTDNISLKYSPEIRFYYDEEWDKVNAVEELLKKIK
jgi:ribosome-binding factor A